jgi:hypothetical protein
VSGEGARLTVGSPGWSIVQPCWLCGRRQPTDHMVADGTTACTDVRWYCADARACTERWTRAPQNPPTRSGTDGVAQSQEATVI